MSFVSKVYGVSLFLAWSLGMDAHAFEVPPEKLAKMPAPFAGKVDFQKDVKPILEASCLKCHGSEKPKGGFSVANREVLLKSGENGPHLVPGKSLESHLLLVSAKMVPDMEMPPEGKAPEVNAQQLGILRAWIDQGAPWPENSKLELPMEEPAVKAIANVELPPLAARTVDFVKDIQPLFARHCADCHGTKKQEAGLRLDSESILLTVGSDSGPTVIPHKSAESLLVHLVSGKNPDMIMPPKGEKLSNDQIGLIRAWIDQGAAFPEGPDPGKLAGNRDHWAFKAPRKPGLPSVQNSSWPKTPIDYFVLAKLEQQKINPSVEADKRTLIRRLSLDLLGLPPTLEEIEQFLGDKSEKAYENLVERLLSSPHYGERWGRHWLDAARYADTNGYEKDQPRNIWPYRDWVINAFNNDMPFDQFTIEQLAGDLLPSPSTSQVVATGFLRNSMLNEEGGVDPEQFRVEGIIDRVDTIGKAFLGLSVACSQCHNHKYDPISQKEYYKFFAFLNNDDEPEIEVPSEEQVAKREDIKQQVERLESELLNSDKGIKQRQAEWEAAALKDQPTWQVLDMVDWFGAIGVKFEKLDDGSLLALAHNPGESSYNVTVRTDLTNITAIRLEALTDANLPRNGPGRANNGNFVVQEFTAAVTPANNQEITNKVYLQNATADHHQDGGFEPSKAIDGDPKTGWAIAAGPALSNQDRKIVFELKEPVGFEGGTLLSFSIFQKHGGAHTLGRFRLSASTSAHPVKADPLPSKVRAIISKPLKERTPQEDRAVFGYYRTIDPAFAETNKKILDLYNQWPIGTTTLALKERKHPRKTTVFRRGDFKKPGAPVQPGVPGVLHPLTATEKTNRLTLAKWIIDPKNPLTPRVMVNRIWQSYFGEGFVPTPEDLGTRADASSHPELLDWLACEFRDKGWKTKQIHRLIVNSATYRQSSIRRPEIEDIDPYNRLLARAPRLRVEAEIIRDIALRASGLLTPKIGGPSVYPPIPDGVLNLGFGAPMNWPTSVGPDRYRRGLYTFWKRTVPYPSLSIFDAPNGDFGCVRRVKSNTPLQALTTLNDTVFVETAKALALRTYKNGGSDDENRLKYGFALCTGRHPDERELSLLKKHLDDQYRYFEDNTVAAVEVASLDPKNPVPNLNLHRLAAWTMVSRVLLNLDETIVKE
ncbi:MAG: DUF1553 domain-containing protein [Verrucomicrobiales bacterium]